MERDNSRNFDPTHLVNMQRRIERTCFWLLVPFFLLTARLVQLQAFHKSAAASVALDPTVFSKSKKLPATRGEILAADGTAMAVTLDEYSVCANPRAITQHDKAVIIQTLVDTIGGDAATYQALMSKTTHANGDPNRYVQLAKRVDADRIQRLRAVMKGDPKKENRDQRAARQKLWEQVWLDPTPRRHYPLGNFASQLVGFTTNDGEGVDGLEAAQQTLLAGKPGEEDGQVDAQGRPLPGFTKVWQQPVAGQTLVTTIDPKIQANADAVMQRLVDKYHPNFATAIVMKPGTGEIVAMSTAPSYDLNGRPKSVVDLATNRCMSFAYEPGSTFKIITASAAVERVPDWQSHSFDCEGVQQVGKHMMHCWISSTKQRRHGIETLSTSIRDSCNFGVYGFARLMGAPTLLEYAKKFGLGKRVRIAGLAEHPGLLPANDPRSWSQEQLANFSFGQGMLMTPLQLIRVAATIANDGLMMKPMLVKEIRDENGKVLQEVKPEVDHRVIAVETARTVTGMMERVTREGTASKFVFVPGYVTAGKTGSAQKAEGKKGYAAGKFISSFVGFLPAQKPEYVILIMADEPHGSHWGSEVCGPAFADIATDAMLHLRLREGTAAPQPAADLMVKPAKPAAKID